MFKGYRWKLFGVSGNVILGQGMCNDRLVKGKTVYGRSSLGGCFIVDSNEFQQLIKVDSLLWLTDGGQKIG